MKKINVAVIGTGNMGQHHVRVFSTLRKVKLIAVCDQNIERAKELAQKYGTPLYVYEAGRVRENFQRLNNAFKKEWPRFQIYYAVKSNSNPHVVKLLMDEGAFCDCASLNEILLAQKLGAKGKQILFSGNYLNDEDLKGGIASGAYVNLDDATLLERPLKFGRPEVLSFRINPDIGKSNVHESDVMAGREAKFGIPWEKAKEAYAKAKKDNFTGTDEASLVERLGASVELVVGDPWNLKITTPQDLKLAELILENKL